MLNNIPPTAMAPMYAGEPRCPTIVTSISPSSGTVIFDIIDGMAICNIRLFTEDFFICHCIKTLLSI